MPTFDNRGDNNMFTGQPGHRLYLTADDEKRLPKEGIHFVPDTQFFLEEKSTGHDCVVCGALNDLEPQVSPGVFLRVKKELQEDPKALAGCTCKSLRGTCH